MEIIEKPIIVALDTCDFKRSQEIIDELFTQTIWFKVGMEAFYSHGEKLLNYLTEKKTKIFLDLKLHDIPTTTAKSIVSLLSRYQVEIINIHALGGLEMMKEVAATVKEHQFNTKVIAVTILTSHDEKTLNSELGINSSTEKAAFHLAKLALKAGLDGVVCSAHEAPSISQNFPEDFLIVTPGIRYLSKANDQKRVATPKAAFEKGATHIVMGREITQAKNPSMTLTDIKGSIYE